MDWNEIAICHVGRAYCHVSVPIVMSSVPIVMSSVPIVMSSVVETSPNFIYICEDIQQPTYGSKS